MYTLFKNKTDELITIRNTNLPSYCVDKAKAGPFVYSVKYDGVDEFEAKLDIIGSPNQFHSLAFSYQEKSKLGVELVTFYLANPSPEQKLTCFGNGKKGHITLTVNCSAFAWQALLDDLLLINVHFGKVDIDEFDEDDNFAKHCKDVLSQFYMIVKTSFIASGKASSVEQEQALFNTLNQIKTFFASEAAYIKQLPLQSSAEESSPDSPRNL